MKVESYRPEQPIHVVIEFKNVDEAKELLGDLRTWQPMAGWSDLARGFFTALEEAIDEPE